MNDVNHFNNLANDFEGGRGPLKWVQNIYGLFRCGVLYRQSGKGRPIFLNQPNDLPREVKGRTLAAQEKRDSTSGQFYLQGAQLPISKTNLTPSPPHGLYPRN